VFIPIVNDCDPARRIWLLTPDVKPVEDPVWSEAEAGNTAGKRCLNFMTVGKKENIFFHFSSRNIAFSGFPF
jgi:hypothetical protein